jgi:hypothetical protein
MEELVLCDVFAFGLLIIYIFLDRETDLSNVGHAGLGRFLLNQEMRRLPGRYKGLGLGVELAVVKMAGLSERLMCKVFRDRLNDLDDVVGILDATLSMLCNV